MNPENAPEGPLGRPANLSKDAKWYACKADQGDLKNPKQYALSKGHSWELMNEACKRDRAPPPTPRPPFSRVTDLHTL